MEVHQCLETFEVHVLARPAPPIDVLTLQDVVESRRADLDMKLEARVPKFEAPSTEPTEDTVLVDLLFSTTAVPPPLPREHANRHRGRNEYKARAQKREIRE